MPLAAENFIQENSGTVTTAGTSHVVSLPSGTTAGNTLIVVIVPTSGIPSGPAEFALDKQVGTLCVFRKSEVAASETSWTFTTGGSVTSAWYVAEISNMGSVEPLDASASNSGSVGNGGTLASGTTPLNASLNTLLLAAFESDRAGSETQSWSGYTNGFEEVAQAGVPSSTRQLAVARSFITGVTGTFSSTATFATTGASVAANALLVAYRSADSPIAAPLAMLAGMEWGTHGGINAAVNTGGILATPVGGLTATGTFGTNYLIQAGSARNSSYGLRVVAAGATANVNIGTFTGAGFSLGMDVRVVSATGTVVVARVSGAVSTVVELLYDATNSKFGVRCGSGGTVSWQSGTTATNTWVWIDLRLKVNTSTWHADWRLETAADTYTDQTAAELTGQAVESIANQSLQLGNNASQTMTADYDNVCISAYYVAYPLGPHQIRLLTVDTAATVTYSGTPGNFSKFTANGTLTTLAGSGGNITTTDVATMLDEAPPTVSASADGVCQTATAASDYLQFPMAAATLAADEVIDGVRMLAAMWGGAGAGTGTVGIRGWDGTTETTLVPASTSYDAGSPTAVSSTEPRWQCAMWQWPTGGWTKTRLDAAALRFGFSSDAAPDMGTDAMYLEYATHKTTPEYVFGGTGALRVEQDTDPNTAGIRTLRAYTPVGQTATLVYELSGTPQTPVTIAGGSNPQTIVIDAPDLPTVSRIELVPD